ncbi:MAG: hypothetical protein QOD51_2324, partial [Candidatus Eremiobacteraeota bacterium]|nr:hypothetical protein [Candidatus Eremiobacteraeota bacterium]
GDARLTSGPASAQWRASTLLPGDPTRSLLALNDDLALRRAVRAFLVAEATPRGFDNGVNQTSVRSRAEILLSDLAAQGSAPNASQAGDLLGVLVAKAGRVTGGVTADDRARAAFEAAVRRDPSNVDAKYNLELLLRRTKATTTRQGPGSGSGALAHGRRGAGAGTPGRGY